MRVRAAVARAGAVAIIGCGGAVLEAVSIPTIP